MKTRMKVIKVKQLSRPINPLIRLTFTSFFLCQNDPTTPVARQIAQMLSGM